MKRLMKNLCEKFSNVRVKGGLNLIEMIVIAVIIVAVAIAVFRPAIEAFIGNLMGALQTNVNGIF